jgi:hypothetical protein
MVERLAQDCESRVRSWVARLVRDPAIFEQLSNDPDPSVLYLLAHENRAVPVEIQARISQRLREYS